MNKYTQTQFNTYGIEVNNFLYVLSPFPQPTNNSVSIKIYWDPILVMDKRNINGEKLYQSENITIDFIVNYWGYIKWDCPSIKSGIYIVLIKHGSEQRTTKVLITK